MSENDSGHPVDPWYRARSGHSLRAAGGKWGGKREGWMEARVLRQHSDVQTSKHLDLSGSGRLCRVSALPSCCCCCFCCDSSTTYPSLQFSPSLSSFHLSSVRRSLTRTRGPFRSHPFPLLFLSLSHSLIQSLWYSSISSATM